MKQISIFIATGCLILMGSGLMTTVSYAQSSNTNTPSANQANTPANQPTAPTSKTILDFNKPVAGDLPALLNRLVNILFTLIASVSIIFIIIGGFRLAFSQGKSEAVTSGKQTITWAIIGLIVALLAFAIVRIVVNILY